jgi:hypothetical protein
VGLWRRWRRRRQYCEGKDYVSLFPPTFKIEQGETACKVPESIRPQCHINYENRYWDWCVSAGPPQPRLLIMLLRSGWLQGKLLSS